MRIRRRDFAALLPGSLLSAPQTPAERTVVLTLDDAVKSHRTFVGPLLNDLGFGATFFVTHRWMSDTQNFMTWRDIADLHGMGFEIGNHSWTHSDFSVPRNAARLAGELALVENELRKVGVPKPISFAWCGNTFGPEAIEVVRTSGMRFARRGGAPEVEYGKIVVGPSLDVKRHHPLLIPTTADGYPDWTFDHFLNVLKEAKDGRIVVLQFHGVPDVAHPWVHTPPDAFRRYMQHLKTEGYRVIALRDLQTYYDLEKPPQDPLMQSRYRPPKDGRLVLPAEMEATRKNLPYWLRTMAEHGYSRNEIEKVTGQSAPSVALETSKGLRVRPYPGGRHPRIGFLDGAIDPMRGTKASVFLPWDNAGYVVVDVPEAIFYGENKLLFLAHTHIPSVWDEQNMPIANRDWEIGADGSLRSEWVLPNKIAFGASVGIRDNNAVYELWLRNGTNEPLTRLRTQVCIMLKGAPDFAPQTAANKVLEKPWAGAKSASGNRWILTTWERCGRVWGNPPCPCIHSDPVLPDCPPGETVKVAGRIEFYEGTDINTRIRA
jgi:peptidoglycan/xylan/chitin deacetylase (PgdA/CDA1 family)